MPVDALPATERNRQTIRPATFNVSGPWEDEIPWIIPA
jgi:hypothetical protein